MEDKRNVQKRTKVLQQPELPITYPKRLCVRCGKAEVYLDTETMDHCEPCLWNLLSADPDFQFTRQR
jgi:hypothetical protein